jgi:hypothetical protein
MTDTATGSPLRQGMIQDMAARKLNRHTQRSTRPNMLLVASSRVR